VAEFDELFRTALSRSTRTRRTQLELVISAESEPTARDLAERETQCCGKIVRSQMFHADSAAVARFLERAATGR
jgi:hypothetical protein